jgi:hypothetical protein
MAVMRPSTCRLVERPWEEPPIVSPAEVEAALDMLRRGEQPHSPPRRRRAGPYLVVDGYPELYIGDEQPILPRWMIEGVQTVDLRHAVNLLLHRAYEVPLSVALVEDEIEPIEFLISAMPSVDFWELHDERAEGYLPVEPFQLLVTDKRIWVKVVVSCPTGSNPEAIRQIVAPILSRTGAALEAVEQSWQTSTEVGWELLITPRHRGVNLGGVLSIAENVYKLIEAATGRELTMTSVLELIRAGQLELLIGLEETEWLDAKAGPYDLDTEGGRIEVSQDVARFANAGGGIIAIGWGTKRRHGNEVINRVTAFDTARLRPSRWRRVLDARVYPPIEGLEIL